MDEKKTMGYRPTLEEALKLCRVEKESFRVKDINSKPWHRDDEHYVMGAKNPPRALLKAPVDYIGMYYDGFGSTFVFVMDTKAAEKGAVAAENDAGVEQWDNRACKGYAVEAMCHVGLSDDLIDKVLKAMDTAFETLSVQEAHDMYVD